MQHTIEDACKQTLDQLYTTLCNRGKSYGSFFDNSRVAVRLQAILQGEDSTRRYALHDLMCLQNGLETPSSLAYVVLNAQNHIAQKLSRIARTPLHADSWLDLAGYAILAHAAIALEAEKAKTDTLA